ncbi:MAG: 2-hydroxyacyl-CoA dehydratase [Bacteroidales bacterium]|nr:2-hydroxyacyl-CoA dehydratase [Bacteroidales bacterium]
MTEMQAKTYRLGIDAGSTTIKVVAIDTEDDSVCFVSYRRHFADVSGSVAEELRKMGEKLGKGAKYIVSVTGSAGIGLAERAGVPFVQEVLAANRAMQETGRTDFTLLDLGGEDAKMVLFKKGSNPDIRMNGSCAGGTGAFIDQMATLMATEPAELNEAALRHTTIYPIASRCGVFAKTDVQNLVSRRIERADIAASIFNAVALQTVTTLAHGADIIKPVVCTGGPLTFLPALRSAFAHVLRLKEDEMLLMPDAQTATARGAALMSKDTEALSIEELKDRLMRASTVNDTKGLKPLFESDEEFEEWKKNLKIRPLPRREMPTGDALKVYIGIDSGSTTTKFVATDEKGNIIYTSYSNNDGNPLRKVEEALRTFLQEAERRGTKITVAGSAVTGYGEDLVKAALNMDYGIVETMAHFRAAHYVNPNVSFVLDIGGQDIKSIFIRNGAVSGIELNESCSAGCGSFLQSFASMMNRGLTEFADEACHARRPVDLGTRCTVFMNSKVKEALRQDTPQRDIAAGLAISVVKNCLYKVLKMQNLNKIGETIVAQGGTFKNKAVLRSLEQLSGKEVWTTDAPELMGAFGCALYAIRQKEIEQTPSTLNPEETLKSLADIVTSTVECKGCTNNCQVIRFKFPNGNLSFAGNKCERIFHSKQTATEKGVNEVDDKYRYIFDRGDVKREGKMRIGIPRVLNIFENYPFWHRVFTSCGIEPVLSDESTTQLYRGGISSVMSDNICFPAKLTNGHVVNLMSKEVDRIFYPLVIKESKERKDDANCFNCPVVSGYPDVIRSAIDPEGRHGVKFDTPVISFVDEKAVFKSVGEYLESLGFSSSTIKTAIRRGLQEKTDVKRHLIEMGREILERDIKEGRMVIVMTGRPYHIDPLINQRVAQIVTDLGVDVISDDVFREDIGHPEEMNYISQWTYPNRVIHAAHGVASLPECVQLIQVNSFGCGPDSFLMDECSNILASAGKNHTVVRVDEISSPGSIRLRIRSLIESLRQKGTIGENTRKDSYKAIHNSFTEKEKNERTIVIPWFSDSLSPVLPAYFERLGFRLQNLPKPDEQSIQNGLKYGHNEVCYPATLVVGDIVKFMTAHREDRDKYVVGISQTGGQCRATNYLALIKNALRTAGLEDVPILSFNTGTAYGNEQPAFKADVRLALSLAIKGLNFTEYLATMQRAMAPREVVRGTAKALQEKYLRRAVELIKTKNEDKLMSLLEKAIDEFNAIETKDIEPKRIGLIGEIYIKYNSFGQQKIGQWLEEQGIEVVVPSILSFMTQTFVNNKVNDRHRIEKSSIGAKLLTKAVKEYVKSRDRQWEKIKQKFRFYRSEGDIFEMAKDASAVLNLVNQFGEGWLIAGEVMELSRRGIKKIVCLQPFGCIANHIVARGIENRLKSMCPDTALLFLDIDSSVARVNMENRLHFLVDQE